MVRFKHLLKEQSENQVEKFEELKGSYSFQGHVSRKKDLELRNMGPKAVEPDEPLKKGGESEAIVQERMTPFGFYTSTIYKDMDKFITKWTDSRFTNPKGSYLHAFTVSSSADILHVESKKDVEDVKETYQTETEENAALDWSRIYGDFDGVHVFGEALSTFQFKAWDLESTIWFKPKNNLQKQFTWKLDFGPTWETWQDL